MVSDTKRKQLAKSAKKISILKTAWMMIFKVVSQ